MNYRGLNMLNSAFFTLSQDGRLLLNRGKCKGKSPEEIKTLSEVSIATGFCLWVMKQPNIQRIDCYLASCFYNEVAPLIKKIEKGLRNELEQQFKETEESAQVTGFKYGRKPDTNT